MLVSGQSPHIQPMKTARSYFLYAGWSTNSAKLLKIILYKCHKQEQSSQSWMQDFISSAAPGESLSVYTIFVEVSNLCCSLVSNYAIPVLPLPGRLWANMTSSTELQICNAPQCRHRSIKPQPQAVASELGRGIGGLIPPVLNLGG